MMTMNQSVGVFHQQLRGQVDELVSGTNSSDSGVKDSSAADVTKSKCDDGESAVSSEQREKRSPTPEPPGPSASSSSRLDKEVSNLSHIPSQGGSDKVPNRT